MRDDERRLQEALEGLMGGRSGLTVLEAGCGSLSHLRFPADTRVVGIDVAEDQLERNKQLDERICGDIQTCDLGSSRYDVIVCWNVLEHLANPEQALDRFARALRPQGLIVLSAPNLFCLKGLATRYTPYWFHLWFYRNVRGWKEAGTEGNPPFHAYLKTSASQAGIRRFARSKGLAVVYERSSGQGDSRDIIGRKSRKLDLFYRPLIFVVAGLTLGRISPRNIEYFTILRAGS